MSYKTKPCERCQGEGEVPDVQGIDLRRKRVEAGFTQGQLAAKLGGLSSSYVSDIERGVSRPSPEMVKRWWGACEDESRKEEYDTHSSLGSMSKAVEYAEKIGE